MPLPQGSPTSEEQIAARAREIPLGRMAQPEEIARVAVFLSTSEAGWITGELIHVNGGFYMA
jgi:3-oxoacyl-[acyl-carrier protein] reductase